MPTNILGNFWNRFTVPQATEPERARQEHGSKVILVILSFLVASFSLITLAGWYIGVMPLDSFLILVGLTLFFVGGWLLAHRGLWQIASYIPIVAMVITAAYGNYVGGIDAPAMLLYTLSIVLAILLKDRSVQWIILGICLTSYIGLGLAHAFDFLSWHRTADTVFINRLSITVVSLVGITLLLQFLDNQFRSALSRTEKQSREVHTYAERIRGLFESALDGIVFSDLDGVLNDANDSAIALMKVGSRSDLIGRNLVDLVFEDDRTMAWDHLRKTFEEGHGQMADCRFLVREGDIRFVDVNTSLIRDEQKQPYNCVFFLRDVTDRKLAEESLKSSEARYRLLVENAPLGIIAIDRSGCIYKSNPKLIDILGSPSMEATHQINMFTFKPLVEAGISDDFEYCLNSNESVHSEHPYITKWGKQVFLRYHLNPIRDENGKATGVQGIMEDVTQQKQIEEIMLQSAKLASIGGLAAGMAHEINNPLSAMVQGAQMLELILDSTRRNTREQLELFNIDPADFQSYLDKRGTGKYLEGIRASGVRAARIVTDLLNFSRKHPDEMKACNLNDLVNTSLELAATDYNLKKHYDFRLIEIERDLAESLPRVACEHQQIQHVILNLLKNAAQAMAQTGRQPRLWVRTLDRNDFVRLEIEDNGTGIPAEIRDRLFEPFYTTKDIGQGTGLGLWLSWSIIVERHKGKIRVEPGKNKGSCFIVELPARKGEA